MLPPATRNLLRRTDFFLLPLLSLLFLLNSLDRSNIGNAESAGFSHDVGLPPESINKAVSWFFAFFVALQPVGAGLGRKFGAHRYIPTVMVGWGLCTLAMIWVRTEGQLIGTRICIGALEAGFYPTAVSYLSSFYTRYEFAQRLALFYGQYAVAGALGGVVSAAVFAMFPEKADEGVGGWKSWEVLFLVQGIATIAVAGLAAWWLPEGPGKAWWLTSEEKRVAEDRVVRDRAEEDIHSGFGRAEDWDDDEEAAALLQDADDRNPTVRAVSSTTSLTRRDVLDAVFDWKVWYILVINILSSIPGIAFSIFLPIILKPLAHTAILSNLLAVPPFLAGAITLYITTVYSDRARKRIRYILLGLSLSTIGLGATYALSVLAPEPNSHSAPKYLSLCLILSGSYIASPLTIAWFTANITHPSKRAVVLGINGWGNLAGVLAPWIFAPRYAPSYTTSLGLTMVLVGVSTVGYVAFEKLLRSENEWRARVCAEWAEREKGMEARTGRGRVPEALRRGRWWEGTVPRRGERRLTSVYGL